MRPIHQLFGSVIPMIASIAILFYVCRRYPCVGQVRRARENIQYIGEQVVKGMDEIEGDVGEELRITDRLTVQSSKLATVLRRFAELEETVIELVRMDRNRESVRIETPENVNEEIRRIIAAVEEKRKETREEQRAGDTRDGIATVRDTLTTHRTALSKFSTCGPREIAFDRPRTPITPEVRLLGEQMKPTTPTAIGSGAEAKRES
ncbi:PREDICTED: uncharacterized protein LOC107195173 [Dufourea novaeangliae]|uniref:uncharacterized protein LOC107195173 n=1 Tax=Dufourea novaeangliae TaxID=178035 RepID=UPI0007672323|nr:PREDICTED: uncharacterized protein LOC107195173 [Dufourea novaeangliae]